MPVKSKQKCVIRNLPVQPRGRLTSDTCENLVRELVKHLLYMRNQIPGLFEDLDWQVQARSKRESCWLPENEQITTENFVGYLTCGNSMELVLAGVRAPAGAAS